MRKSNKRGEIEEERGRGNLLFPSRNKNTNSLRGNERKKKEKRGRTKQEKEKKEGKLKFLFPSEFKETKKDKLRGILGQK